MKNQSVTLLLDFDGVTHPQPCFQENVFCRLHLIESVLRERELRDVEIVISSSWRAHHSLDDMREFFSLDIQARVIGVTQDLPKLTGGGLRELECKAWMKKNRPPGARWLAIDDRPNWFTPGCENLLVTDGKYGFHPDDAARLRDMLWERI